MCTGAGCLLYLDSDAIAILKNGAPDDPPSPGGGSNEDNADDTIRDPSRTYRGGRRADAAGEDEAPSTTRTDEVIDLLLAMNRCALRPLLREEEAREKEEHNIAVRDWRAGVEQYLPGPVWYSTDIFHPLPTCVLLLVYSNCVFCLFACISQYSSNPGINSIVASNLSCGEHAEAIVWQAWAVSELPRSMHAALRRLSTCAARSARQLTRARRPPSVSLEADRPEHPWIGDFSDAPDEPFADLLGLADVDDRDAALWDYFERTRPSNRELEARGDALRKIRYIVHKYAAKHNVVFPSGAKLAVEPFGSTLIGVDAANSDLDLVVLDPRMPQGFKPGISYNKVPNILYDVEKLARMFRENGCTNIEPIPHARVPLVRGVVPDVRNRNIQTAFDLCINARNGLYNSRLLAAYAELDARLAPLLVILKAWAKHTGLDAPVKLKKLTGRGKKGKKGKIVGVPRPFSSYTLGQMVVAFMQHMGLLPNLQDAMLLAESGAQALAADEPTVYWSVTQDRDRRIASDVRFADPHSAAVQSWRASQSERDAAHSLLNLLQRFFDFYGNRFKPATHAISVRDGGIVPRPGPGARPLAAVGAAKVGEDGRVSPDAEEADSALLSGAEDAVDPLALSRALAAPTNMHVWRARPLVIVDPIVRKTNIAQQVSEKELKRFNAECRSAADRLEGGAGLDDLLSKSRLQSEKDERKKAKKEKKAKKKEKEKEKKEKKEEKKEKKKKAKLEAEKAQMPEL